MEISAYPLLLFTLLIISILFQHDALSEWERMMSVYLQGEMVKVDPLLALSSGFM
jgi:hypothetical protein